MAMIRPHDQVDQYVLHINSNTGTYWVAVHDNIRTKTIYDLVETLNALGFVLDDEFIYLSDGYSMAHLIPDSMDEDTFDRMPFLDVEDYDIDDTWGAA